jgi:hypothetical protein
MKNKKRWDKEEDNFLIENYEKLGAEKCALKLQKTLSSIYSRATTLNIQRKIELSKTGVIPKRIINQIKIHAKTKNRICSITEEDIFYLWIKQSKKCALSGIYIQFHNTPKLSTASVDRIDSKKDYTIDNIQLLHKDINLSKRIYSDEYYIYLCKLVAENNKNLQLERKSLVWLDDHFNDTIYPINTMSNCSTCES